MNTIFFLIGCSVLVAILFLFAFIWSQNNGQNDDLYTPSIRMLMDDEEPHPRSLTIDRNKSSEGEGSAVDNYNSK